MHRPVRHLPRGAAIARLSSEVAGGIAPRAALAHHIDAQRPHAANCAPMSMSKVAVRQPVHVVGEAFPGPWQSGAQHRLGDILDAFHQLKSAADGRTDGRARSLLRNCPSRLT